jgi:hypothetical protein
MLAYVAIDVIAQIAFGQLAVTANAIGEIAMALALRILLVTALAPGVLLVAALLSARGRRR